MIIIYSADANGRLFTDPKQRAYIDAPLLREKACAVRTAAVLDKIARHFGYNSFDGLDSFARSSGITLDVLLNIITSGKIADVLRSISN